ncbi:uncharacterized protein AB675_2490 [Cyphellophora attinorum]|uniref:RRM domain-containing protein n=1 Tax=Cyphellophora attinorum TaxID=1664694 RepID=A0A0N1HAV3_9EURO|nr:uncharacterized protein AB675_2490 [Phialophora attinorum]KPI45193.1 hypothetical protein AB675_2490 [Phialophora attinorum]
MSDQKSAVDFNQMIQADRARRKNEQLAANIFGRNRSKQNDGGKVNRSASNSPSLASRIGIAKRTPSTTSNSSQGNPFRPALNRNSSSQAQQRDRANRISHALDASNTSTSQRPTSKSGGLSIKGKAGPWTVVATNFAPGTTAADIEASISHTAVDDDGQQGLISCHITSTQPVVTAEFVLTERTIADRIISTYNNQLADGRYLKLQLQKPQAQSKEPSHPPKATQPSPSPRHDTELYSEDADMLSPDDVAPGSTQATAGNTTEPSRYDSDREDAAASRDRRDRETRRDDPRDDHHRDGPPRSPPRDDRDMRRGGPPREHDRDRDMMRDRERRYDDRGGGYDRRGGYDDHRGGYDRRYDDRGPPSGHFRGRGGDRGGSGRGYAGSISERYARANGGGGSYR